MFLGRLLHFHQGRAMNSSFLFTGKFSPEKKTKILIKRSDFGGFKISRFKYLVFIV
jgi:hypothetical protein